MSRRTSAKNTPPPAQAEAESEAVASVDLSKLFTFNPTTLELVLKTVLTRLDNLEGGSGDAAGGSGPGKKGGRRTKNGSAAPAGSEDNNNDDDDAAAASGPGASTAPATGADGITRQEYADLKDQLDNHNNRIGDLEKGVGPAAKKRGALGNDAGADAQGEGNSGADPNAGDGGGEGAQGAVPGTGGTIGGWGDRKAKDLEDRLKSLENALGGEDDDAAGDGDADIAAGAVVDAGDAGQRSRGGSAVNPGLRVGELSKRVGRLENEGAMKNADVKPLKDAHDDLANEVAALQKQLADLQNDTDKKANQEAVNALEKDAGKLKSDMDNLSKEMDNLRAEHGKVQARLGTLEGLTTLLNSKEGGEGLGKELNSFTDTLGDVKGKQAGTEADVDALRAAVKNLENATEDLDKDKEAVVAAEKKFKAIEEELQDLKQKQRDLEDGVGEAAVADNDAKRGGSAANNKDFVTKPMLNYVGGRVDDLEKRLEGLARRPSGVGGDGAAGAAGVNSGAAADGAGRSDAGEGGTGGEPADLTELTNRLNGLYGKHNGLLESYDSFRKEARGDLANLHEAQTAQKKEISALGTECSKMSADLGKRLQDIRRLEDTKANKGDLDALKENTDKVVIPLAAGLSGLQSVKDQLIDTSGKVAEQGRTVNDLKNNLSTLQGSTGALQNEKAGKDLVGHLSVDVSELTRKVGEIAATRPSNKNRGDAASEDAVKEVQSQINKMILGAATDRDWAAGQLVEIRATVDHIHHSKADASLVANKAERDYVENAMEKLMREVEQVLNTTNSGLIDTIDKSLNILRDMIDGKATKDDVNGLKKSMQFSQEGGAGADGTGAVPDGLMGYKGYRCLGCNRTMDGMRQRPMGGNFSNFMNRVPNNSRVPKPPSGQASIQASPTNTGAPAGYLTAGPPGSA